MQPYWEPLPKNSFRTVYRKLWKKTSGCCKKRAKNAEDAFYQFSALTFAYSRAGMEPLPTGEAITMNEAPDDSLPLFRPEYRRPADSDGQ